MTKVVVAGGGPGGALLSYLLARAGIGVTLLESRPDFVREYRGDSLHPYTMELLDQLGLARDVLELPHVKAAGFTFHTPDGDLTVARYARLRTPFNYVAIMQQHRLIQFLVDRAARHPGFEVRMNSRVTGLLRADDGSVTGVRTRDGELRADLVIGFDGRYSTVRKQADLPIESQGASTDLIWFRLPRTASDPDDADLGLFCGPGRYAGVLNGDDHWRIGVAIAKGSYPAAREAGVGELQDFVRTYVPWLADRAGLLTDFADTSLLSVDIAATPRWHRPGLLLLGDAAHVISPVGGNGILMAVQDAVTAANRLVGPLRAGRVEEADLAAVQADREPAIRRVQAEQVRTEQRLARSRAAGTIVAPPRWLRPVFALPPVQRRAARSNAYGPNPPRLDLALVDGRIAIGSR